MYASSSSLANSTTVLASTAPAVVIGASNAATDSGTGVTLTVPAGAVVGDLLVAVISHRGSGTITGPPGWTSHTHVSSGTTLAQRIWDNVAGTSDLTTTHTFLFNTAAPVAGAGVLIVIRGAQMPRINGNFSVNAAAATIAVPALTMAAQSAVVLISASKATSEAHSPISGWTLNPAATGASATNRVSVQYRSTTTANPPSATIAAGTTAAVSLGTQYAWSLSTVSGMAETAQAGALTVTGAAAMLVKTPHAETVEPDGYVVAGREAYLVHTPIWGLITTLGATAESYSDTTATPATTYRYRIVGVNGAWQTPSNEIQVTTISGSTFAETAAPGGVALTGAAASFATERLTAAPASVTATGLAATLANPPIAWEVVESIGGTTQTYSDFGLEPSTGYVYRVVAVNATAETISNVVVVFTLAATGTNFGEAAFRGIVISTGAATTLALALPALRATHTVTGTQAIFALTRLFPAIAGGVTSDGADATLRAATHLTATTGTLALTGAQATFLRYFSGQQSLPMADVTDGAWTPSSGADLYATIDDASDEAPADADYMRTVTPASDTAVVTLEPMSPPPAGEVQILVRTRTS